MSKNESAFPVVAANGLGHVTDGMSIRDWFAGQALAGMKNPNDGDYSSENVRFSRPEMEAKWRADAAYRIADAMLEARSK